MRLRVRLTVEDSGHGMGTEVLERAFEPFYTTKPKGQGTGLGLATVYGIVTQAGGSIEIDSQPGEGTTVSVLLPASDGHGRRSGPAPPAPDGLAAGGETILVVEDEDAVRRLDVPDPLAPGLPRARGARRPSGAQHLGPSTAARSTCC